MNKLIIVGNGFDLAHGLRTSYGQFLETHLINRIDEALGRSGDESEFVGDSRLFRIKVKKSFVTDLERRYPVKNAGDIYNIFQTNTEFFDRGRGCPLIYKPEESYISQYVDIEIQTSINLIKKLIISGRSLLWVDIETIFYDEMKLILNSDDLTRGQTIEQLNNLNSELDSLKHALLEHLEIETLNAKINYDLIDLIHEDVHSFQVLERDFVNNEIFERASLQFNKTIFLDFNYTYLVRRFSIRERSFQYINIHGVLNDPENPIIFGYGDEIDESYQAIEKTNINEYMTNIKSFGYFKTQNYSDLKRIIDSEPFVVYIWGHSCGLSDRTLLNMIFENDNCIGIKIFYYKRTDGTDNYDEITQNISRHFKNKMKMRNRVFNKTLCQEMPQMKQ